MCAAVLAASSEMAAGWQVIVYVFISLLVYWAAESFADLLAARTVRGTRIERGELTSILRDGWRLVAASYLPLLVVAVCSLLGLGVGTAVNLALAATVGLLGIAGWIAGRRSGLQGAWLVGATLLATMFGLVMIALKLAIH